MFLIFFLLLIPLIFQFVVGNKAIHGYTSLKFWQACIISIIGQILMIISSFFLMLNEISKSGLRDGMPALGVFVIGTLIGILILVVIAIQLYTKLYDT